MKLTSEVVILLITTVLIPHIQACFGSGDKEKPRKPPVPNTTVAPKVPTPPSEIGREFEICGKNYIMSHSEADWSSAKSKCDSTEKYSLLSIDSKKKDECLVKYFANDMGGSMYEIWTSGSDLKSPGRFRWMNTKEYIEHSMHQSWSSGQPDSQGGSEHCISATFNEDADNALWYDTDCEKKYKFICQAR